MLWWTLRQLKSRNEWKRIKAIGKLGESKDVRAFEHLISALSDSSSLVRVAAVQTLGQVRDTRATEPLVKLLGDYNVRHAAAKALSQISTETGDRRFYTLIATLFMDSRGAESKERQRIEAVKELGATGDARAVEPLITAITDVDERVQTAAIEALEELGDDRALEPLKELYGRKGLFKIRDGAEPDVTTETMGRRAQTVAKAAAAAIKKFDPDWSELIEVPHFIIIFRVGAEQPADPVQYYLDVAKRALGKELMFQGWRIAGTPKSISEYEARSIYHSSTALGGDLPNWGAPIKTWEGIGPDRKNVVALFFA